MQAPVTHNKFVDLVILHLLPTGELLDADRAGAVAFGVQLGQTILAVEVTAREGMRILKHRKAYGAAKRLQYATDEEAT